ncbi:sugar transferase [Halobacteriovorax sp. ZH5_bin.2]|uniref:sugar transferase n=1 Tax=Halobacteriovorax sp. ZH5_bin.2 TaxID=3157727 RepID=UPI0037172F29
MHNYLTRAKFFIFLDFLVYYTSLALTLYLRGGRDLADRIIEHFEQFSLLFFLWIILNYIEGLYSLRSISKDGLAVSVIRSSLLNIAIGFGYFYLNPFTHISPKTNMIISVLVSSSFIYLLRRFFFLSNKRNLVDVLIVGDGSEVTEVKNFANSKKYLGYNVISKRDISGEDFAKYDLFVIEDDINKKDILKVLNQRFNGKDIISNSKFCESIIGKVPVSSLDSSWFYNNEIGRRDYLYEAIKFVVDRFSALLLIFITIPIYVILFPILLITSGRPFFYSQIRTGYKNRSFRIYKLRTMKTDAETSGAKWATPNDDRVTPIGRFLRASRLDELPQLWNILRGDMSLIGPRPERPEIIDSNLEGKIPYYKFRHLVKPGVTGWAQVNYGYGYSDDDSFIKLQYDLYYVKNKNIWLDLRIFLKTVKTVLTGIGH